MPTVPQNLLILHLDFSDSLTALETGSDSLGLSATQCHCRLCPEWAGSARHSGAAPGPAVRGVWKGVSDGTNPRHQPRVSNSLGKARFASGCEGFLFSMDFAALAWTEIAPKLLLLLHLPGWICQAGLGMGGCAVLPQLHPVFGAGSTGE